MQHNLTEEISVLVDQLRTVVHAAIAEGHNDVDDLVFNSINHLYNVWEETKVSLDQQWQTLIADLNTIKDLAASANVNIDLCLSHHEDVIQNLPDGNHDRINGCVLPFVNYVNNVRRDTLATIGNFYNDVENLAEQVQACSSNIVCLSPLVTEITLAEDQIPKDIAVEFVLARTYIMETNLVFDNCMDVATYQMVTAGNTALNSITTCVNDIMNQ